MSAAAADAGPLHRSCVSHDACADPDARNGSSTIVTTADVVVDAGVAMGVGVAGGGNTAEGGIGCLAVDNTTSSSTTNGTLTGACMQHLAGEGVVIPAAPTSVSERATRGPAAPADLTLSSSLDPFEALASVDNNIIDADSTQGKRQDSSACEAAVSAGDSREEEQQRQHSSPPQEAEVPSPPSAARTRTVVWHSRPPSISLTTSPAAANTTSSDSNSNTNSGGGPAVLFCGLQRRQQQPQQQPPATPTTAATTAPLLSSPLHACGDDQSQPPAASPPSPVRCFQRAKRTEDFLHVLWRQLLPGCAAAFFTVPELLELTRVCRAARAGLLSSAHPWRAALAADLHFSTAHLDALCPAPPPPPILVRLPAVLPPPPSFSSSADAGEAAAAAAAASVGCGRRASGGGAVLAVDDRPAGVVPSVPSQLPASLLRPQYQQQEQQQQGQQPSDPRLGEPLDMLPAGSGDGGAGRHRHSRARTHTVDETRLCSPASFASAASDLQQTPSATDTQVTDTTATAARAHQQQQQQPNPRAPGAGAAPLPGPGSRLHAFARQLVADVMAAVARGPKTSKAAKEAAAAAAADSSAASVSDASFAVLANNANSNDNSDMSSGDMRVLNVGGGGGACLFSGPQHNPHLCTASAAATHADGAAPAAPAAASCVLGADTHNSSIAQGSNRCCCESGRSAQTLSDIPSVVVHGEVEQPVTAAATSPSRVLCPVTAAWTLGDSATAPPPPPPLPLPLFARWLYAHRVGNYVTFLEDVAAAGAGGRDGDGSGGAAAVTPAATSALGVLHLRAGSPGEGEGASVTSPLTRVLADYGALSAALHPLCQPGACGHATEAAALAAFALRRARLLLPFAEGTAGTAEEEELRECASAPERYHHHHSSAAASRRALCAAAVLHDAVVSECASPSAAAAAVLRQMLELRRAPGGGATAAGDTAADAHQQQQHQQQQEDTQDPSKVSSPRLPFLLLPPRSSFGAWLAAADAASALSPAPLAAGVVLRAAIYRLERAGNKDSVCGASQSFALEVFALHVLLYVCVRASLGRGPGTRLLHAALRYLPSDDPSHEVSCGRAAALALLAVDAGEAAAVAAAAETLREVLERCGARARLAEGADAWVRACVLRRDASLGALMQWHEARLPASAGEVCVAAAHYALSRAEEETEKTEENERRAMASAAAGSGIGSGSNSGGSNDSAASPDFGERGATEFFLFSPTDRRAEADSRVNSDDDNSNNNNRKERVWRRTLRSLAVPLCRRAQTDALVTAAQQYLSAAGAAASGDGTPPAAAAAAAFALPMPAAAGGASVAMRLLNTTLALEPTHARAAVALARLYERLGDREAAARVLGGAIRRYAVPACPLADAAGDEPAASFYEYRYAVGDTEGGTDSSITTNSGSGDPPSATHTTSAHFSEAASGAMPSPAAAAVATTLAPLSAPPLLKRRERVAARCFVPCCLLLERARLSPRHARADHRCAASQDPRAAHPAWHAAAALMDGGRPAEADACLRPLLRLAARPADAALCLRLRYDAAAASQPPPPLRRESPAQAEAEEEEEGEEVGDGCEDACGSAPPPAAAALAGLLLALGGAAAPPPEEPRSARGCLAALAATLAAGREPW